MFKHTLLTAALVLTCSPLHAQVTAAAAAGATAAAPHIVAAVPAILTGAVSSASAHAGQAVIAKVANSAVLSNGFKLPAGSQLFGHITQAKSLAAGKGTSSLGMVFDKFKTPDGQEQPLSGMLQSIGSGKAAAQPSQQASQPAQPNQAAQANPVGGLLGGVTNTVGTTVGTVASTTTGLLGTVTGLPGVLLDSSGTLNAQGKNVEVPAGTSLSIQASSSTNVSQ